MLDLNGDGISYTPLANSNVFFDIDGDKFAERVEWLNKNDGFLVRDLNKNGKIDSVKEMFGEDGGSTAYAKLAKLDSNKDKMIDAKDAAFSTLSVWRDTNGNGTVDSGEMKTLAQWGIKSLSVNVNNVITHNSHAVTGTSTFTRTNGTTGQTVGTLLETNNLDSWYVGDGTAARLAAA